MDGLEDAAAPRAEYTDPDVIPVTFTSPQGPLERRAKKAL